LKELLVSKIEVVSKANQKGLVSLRLSIAFYEQLLEPSNLNGCAIVPAIIDGCGQPVLLEKVVGEIVQIAQPDERFLVSREEPIGLVGEGPRNLHKVPRSMLPVGARRSIHEALFQSVTMGPIEISSIRLGDELLPNAVLIEALGNGLFSISVAPNPSVTHRCEMIVVSVPIDANPHQRLLPIFAQTGPSELVFGVNSERLRDSMIAKRHVPGVLMRGNISFLLCRCYHCSTHPSHEN